MAIDLTKKPLPENSPFVKYDGIVYFKGNPNNGKVLLIAGQSAYIQILPQKTQFETANEKEFNESENKLNQHP